MRAREPFTLTRRNTGKRFVWYYLAYDEDGVRRRYTTGCTSKAQALAHVMELYKTGSLIPDKKKTVKSITFEEYTKNWWTEDCDYIKGEALRGRELSQQYIDTNRNQMIKHIAPRFNRSALRDITSSMIENWQRSLVEKKELSAKSANNILSILSVILEEARREKYIDTNPCKEVRTLANNTRSRGILSFNEVRDLLTNFSYWDNPLCYTASLLAACTGMRLGEVRALRSCDLRDGYIHVEHSVDLQGELKSTKTKDQRDIPIPSTLMTTLRSLANAAGKDGRIFSVAGVPMSSQAIRDGFYRALKEYGITETERKTRNITFHSWRHFLNSQLISRGINEMKARRITGHATAAMTEHYSHFLVSDFEDVLQITESLVQ